MNYIGIDIGTTTICGIVLDDKNNVLKTVSKNNSYELKSKYEYEKIQDPSIIFDTVKTILDELILEYKDIYSIGISGQMHGIVYYDDKGEACSPLYYWQDGRGLNVYKDNKNYVDYIKEVTGYNASSGYGIVTHFYNTVNNLIDENAVGFCTIGDYVAMRLCDKNKTFLHASQAASIGLFDLRNLCFNIKAITKLGLNQDFFPNTCINNQIVGKYKDIDVCVSLGDNQASFMGSGANDDSILLNVGTGSQISLTSSFTTPKEGIELRPLNNHSYLLVGAAICGGKSYNILKDFFEKTGEFLRADVKDIYSKMNEVASDDDCSIKVDTKFLGSRVDPDLRGSIGNIGLDNLTPANLVNGFNNGMAQELYDLYELMGCPNKSNLIGSGNGLRLNNGLQMACEKCFGKKLNLSSSQEDAAIGAALFGKNKLDIEFSRTLKHHYKAKSGWLNDPNGLVYFKGYYHLFYQYAPHFEDPFIEPMYWGHCITKDFINFEELEPALVPNSSYDSEGCWSGTAIVKDDKLFLFYASVVSEGTQRFGKQTVSVAYSTDGIHFEKYENNPIIKEYPKEGSYEFRDPAIIDNGDTYYLVMATGNEQDKCARLVYYQSDDCLNWTYKGVMSEWKDKAFCECPSFMKYDDKYLLTCSVVDLDKIGHKFSTTIGKFDGEKYKEELSTVLNVGPDQYAGQVFLDPKGRHILISWITGWHFDRYYKFSLGCLSTPVEIKVKGDKIIGYPVEECQHLLKDSDENIVLNDNGFIIKRKFMPDVNYVGEIRNMKVIRDEYILEIFLNDGEEIYTVVLC